MERSGAEWSGVERSGAEWSGVEWGGAEWSGVDQSGAGRRTNSIGKGPKASTM